MQCLNIPTWMPALVSLGFKTSRWKHKNETLTQVQDLLIVASFIGFLYANHNWIWLMQHQDHNQYQEYKKEDIEIQRIRNEWYNTTAHNAQDQNQNTQLFFHPILLYLKLTPNSNSITRQNIAVVLSRCVIGAAVLRFYQKLIKRWFPLQSWQLYNDEAAIWENLNSTLRVKWTTLTALS